MSHPKSNFYGVNGVEYFFMYFGEFDGCQKCEDLTGSIGFDRIIYVVHSISSDSVIIHIVLVSK